MFKKFREKLKSWFKKTEEKTDEITEVEKEQIEKYEKIEKNIIKKSEPSLKPKEETKKGFFKKLKEKLKFRITENYFEEIFSELEMLLLENNVALEVVEKIKSDLKKELIGIEINKNEVEKTIKQALRISIESLFPEKIDLIEKIKEKKETYVILFFGINGSGKTTTIAKIANLLNKNNLSCILAASDTFRAASIEQLEKHGEKLKIKTVKAEYNSDPSSVAFDAIRHAKSKKINVVLIDTAGRMYTKKDLMMEMEKICRVSNPDFKIFVAESITGNDAIEQAKNFNETIGIDASVLSKADVDERGGTAISIGHVTGKPILFLGTGQNYEDLEKFDEKKLIESLGLD
ncbi:MAG: signal recognition particle-docking protein FtsY [Nanoarchaeota archaeon]|nr:signal recognition particle-docking protein FtsY [Nanoarchaeota archaeon]